jgi:hypothetical protein
VHNTISTGDGNCFSVDIEEDGDNIDQQVASAYENLYDRDQRRDSIFMETMEDYMKRLSEHSQENQESECKPPLNNTELVAEKDEKILERGHNLLLQRNSDALPVYALITLLRMRDLAELLVLKEFLSVVVLMSVS